MVFESSGEPSAKFPFSHGESSIDLHPFAAAFNFPCLDAISADGLGEAAAAVLDSQTSSIVKCTISSLIDERTSAATVTNVARGSRSLAQGLISAKVGLLVESPGTAYLHGIMDAIKGMESALDVLVTTDDESTGFVVDGYGRQTAGKRLAAAIVEDGELKFMGAKQSLDAHTS